MKKLINKLRTPFICAGFVALASSAQSASCTSTTTFNTAGLYEEISGWDYKTCEYTPEKVAIRLYKIGLCTSAPTPSDTSSCSLVFESTAGELIELGTGSSIQVDASVSLSEGSYTNALIVLGNTFGIKASIEFDTPRTASDGSTGTICYSNGPYDEISQIYDNVSCGATNQAAYSWETLKALPDSVNGTLALNAYLNAIFPGENNTTTNNLYLLDSNQSLSTVTIAQVQNNELVFTDMSLVDRAYILADQAFNSPVQISPNTKTIDLGISVTDAAEFGFTSDTAEPNDGYVCSNNNGEGCIADVVFSGLQLEVEITN